MADGGFPVLLAHTPRAGRWNHTALLPPGLPPGTQVAGYLSCTGRGGNSLAVSAEVRQPTTGRSGTEVLVLAGVRPPDGTQLTQLEAWLRERLTDLGTEIAGFDWSAHSGGPAVFPALAEWRDQAVARFGIRAHSAPLAPLPCVRERGGHWPFAAAVAATAVLALGLVRRYW